MLFRPIYAEWPGSQFRSNSTCTIDPTVL